MKRSAVVFILVLLGFSALAHAAAFRCIIGPTDYIPEPKLVYPYTEEVDLTGKEYLEFKWDTVVLADYFDFKIYKGRDEIAANLIFKQHLMSGAYSFNIKSDVFQDDQVYTWSLKTIIVGVGKSDESFISFKIIKK